MFQVRSFYEEPRMPQEYGRDERLSQCHRLGMGKWLLYLEFSGAVL